MLALDGGLLGPGAAPRGDRALLVGDDHARPVHQQGPLDQVHVAVAVVGVRALQQVGAHRRDDALDLERALRAAHQVGLAGRRALVPGHRRVLVVEDDEEDVLPRLDRVRDRGHLAVEEGPVAHQHVVLVGDQGRGAGAGGPAQAHRRQVVHLLEGRQAGHRVAADAAVGDHVHRPALVDPLHVGGVGQAAADLDHRRARAAVRAAGAVGGRARGHVQGPAGEGGAAVGGGPRPRLGAGREGVRPRQHEPAEHRQGDVRVHPRALGEAPRLAGQPLAPHGLAAPLERAAHLVLDVRRPLLHHHDLVDAVGEAPHDALVEGPGEPQAQDRHLAVDPQLGQGPAQQDVGGAGGHDADPVRPGAGGALDAVEPRRADGRVQQRDPPLEDVGLERGRLRRQRDGLAHPDRRRVERDPAARPHRRRAVGQQLHHARAVGLRRRAHEPDDQLALGRQVEGQAHVVLQLLRARRLEHRDAGAGQREPAVGADLGRRQRRVVPGHDDPGGGGGRAGGVRDGQPVERHVGAHALHDRHGPRAGHLAGAVQHRGALGLVVGELGLDAELPQVAGVALADREHLGHRRAGVAGDERDARLQRPLHDQLVAVEHRPPGPALEGRPVGHPGSQVGCGGGHGGSLLSDG